MFKRDKGNLTENRLILLFLAARFARGIEHDEVAALNMRHDWMLYFDMEQMLAELCDEGLLLREVLEDKVFYAVTAAGADVLGMYYKRIPMSIRSQIDSFARENAQRMVREQEFYAEYECISASHYRAILRIYELSQPIFSLDISAPDEATARAICLRFKQEATDIYAGLVARLTK